MGSASSGGEGWYFLTPPQKLRNRILFRYRPMVQKNGIFSLLFIPFSRNFSLEESENKKFSIRSPLCKSAKGQKGIRANSKILDSRRRNLIEDIGSPLLLPRWRRRRFPGIVRKCFDRSHSNKCCNMPQGKRKEGEKNAGTEIKMGNLLRESEVGGSLPLLSDRGGRGGLAADAKTVITSRCQIAD